MKSHKLEILLAMVVGASAFTTIPPTARLSPPVVTFSTSLQAKAAVPNPFKKLPWVAEKERQREARRMKLERASLHRELGIVEDASYEDIVEATDNLIAAAGDNIKQKIRVEVAKDKILQIRLNERLAGLTAAEQGARAQSSFEKDGGEELPEVFKDEKEWNAPLWTQGLIRKPDAEYRTKQLKLWGFITLAGAAFPPAQEYMNRFTWLVCVAQLRFRGMPKEMTEGGGLGISFGNGRNIKHGKIAWLLGVSIWLVGASLVYGFMPSWAKGHKWTSTAGFAMQNLLFGVACSYLQPYKG